jgi:hypothetical protein
MEGIKMRSIISFIVIVSSVLLLQGCFHDNSAETRSYNISATNLTANQPLSPLAVILHKSDYHGISMGAPVNVSLEKLAESGDNSDFLAEANVNNSVNRTTSGSEVIAPGDTSSVSISGRQNGGLYLTLASMLVNTNDGFAAVDGVDLSNLALQDEMHFYSNAYDSGTEANTETMADIPGPAGGGEGYNSLRNDRDFIAVHPGVISNDDGLSTSILNASHRFDNPVALITVTRTK